MGKKILSHCDLQVYRKAFDAAPEIFRHSKQFPKEEMFSLTDQIRRSSRSVCANLAEAWRKRKYQAAFVAKLCDAESEAAETQVWIEFAVKCDYLERAPAAKLFRAYDEILRMVVHMSKHPESWVIKPP